MKLFGVNLLGVFAAGVVFWMIGALWYAVLFSEAWMNAYGLTIEEIEAGNPAWMGLGVLISFASALGFAKVMAWRGVAGVGDAISTAIILWALFALPVAGYYLVYQPQHALGGYMIDAAHLLVGSCVMAVVISRFQKA